MISVDEALDLVVQNINAVPSQACSLEESLGAQLRADARAQIDLPRFDQSAMDGYALRSDDAGLERVVVDCAEAGHASSGALLAGQAHRIFTGAPIPEGADTVVPQENIERVDDHIRLSEPAVAHRHIRWCGEEVQQGDVIATQGATITPGVIGALAAAGESQVEVSQPLRVALLVTGDEVASAEAELSASAIYDANGPLVRAFLRERGIALAIDQHVVDERQAVTQALAQALIEADLIITTGGASVGDKDFLPQVVEEVGLQRHFWKVKQKPGKPILFATTPDKATALLALPGNPAAVFVGLHLYIATAMRALRGDIEPLPKWAYGQWQTMPKVAPRAQLLRVQQQAQADGTSMLSTLPKQASHMLGNLVHANALAVLEPDQPGGTLSRWLPLGSPFGAAR